MSIELMTVAWKIPDITSTQKLVLLALCDSANDEGVCYPSISALMSKCSLSDRGVQKSISQLEEMNFLTKKMRGGHSTVYVVSLPKNGDTTPERRSPRTTFTPNHVHPTPERRSPPPPNHVHPTPERRSPRNVIETKVETKGNRNKTTLQSNNSKTMLSDFGIDGELASDFIAHRKAKKATISKTALDGFQREADKAGISIADAIRITVERGWVGFKAEWHKQQPAVFQGDKKPAHKAEVVQQQNTAVFQRFLQD